MNVFTRPTRTTAHKATKTSTDVQTTNLQKPTISLQSIQRRPNSTALLARHKPNQKYPLRSTARASTTEPGPVKIPTVVYGEELSGIGADVGVGWC